MSKDIGFYQKLAEQRHKVALELLDDISLLTQQRDDLVVACEAQEESDNWFGASDTGRKLGYLAKSLRVAAIAKAKA